MINYLKRFMLFRNDFLFRNNESFCLIFEWEIVGFRFIRSSSRIETFDRII
jgi:hypothetical protein